MTPGFKIRFLSLVIGSVFLCLTPDPPALGAFISLSSQTQVQYSEGKIEINIEIVNNGDESAYNVQVIAEVEEKTFTSEVKGELGVKEPWEQVFNADLALEKPGKYPVLLTIRYTDANQYPFSAISVPHFSYGQTTSSKVLGILRGMEISSKGSTHLEIKNLDAEPKRVQITFFVPEELSITKKEDIIPLEPREEADVRLTVKNFSALPGSSYPIFAVIEYDSGDRHYSANAMGMVKVVKKDVIGENKTLLIAAAGFLILALVVYNVMSRKRKAR